MYPMFEFFLNQDVWFNKQNKFFLNNTNLYEFAVNASYLSVA